MEIIEKILLFIQTQVLGMKWINVIAGNVVTLIGLDTTSRIGGSLQFFLYDVVKIFILLGTLIFTISYIQSYFPPERTKKILGRFNGLTANTLSALLGTVTPFCSCSSIPLFIGFTSAGLPLGVTFSFLISSPLVDLGSLVLLISIFGFKVAALYIVVGLVLAVVGGTIIEKLKLERYIEGYITSMSSMKTATIQLSRADRIAYAKGQLIFTVKKVAPYIFIGVGIGAIIHNWIPREVITSVLGDKNPFSVFIATAIGIPMYADIFGTIPIAEALHAKGVGLGTIMSFMMAVTALSLPSIIMLRRAVKPPLLVIFVSIVSIGIMFIGYFFNFFQPLIG